MFLYIDGVDLLSEPGLLKKIPVAINIDKITLFESFTGVLTNGVSIQDGCLLNILGVDTFIYTTNSFDEIKRKIDETKSNPLTSITDMLSSFGVQ